jgi:hypothetical protein
MNTTPQDIDRALLDVRKAYRLLHDYQRAALDAAKYIGTQLGFDYQGGYSVFSSSAPNNGRGKLEYSAWDWLNLVCYDFHFQREIVGYGKVKLVICLLSDTGFYVSELTEVSRTDVMTFKAAERSETKVGLLLYRDWLDSFDEARWERTSIRRFIENDGELPLAMTEAGVLGKCCDFARICDEDSANSVIAELIKLAKLKGLQLEQVGKNV